MSRWPTVPLNEIASVGAGNSAPQDPKLFADGTIPFIRTSDVGQIRFGIIDGAEDLLNDEGARGLRVWPAGTILFPKSGASTFLNHRVLMDVDACVASHLATIVADPSRVLSKFLLYYLHTVRAQELTQDQNYPSLRLPEIGAIQVPLPPLAEQNRIVAILDETFEGIAKAAANAERNLANARELFEVSLAQTFREGGDGWIETTIGEICTLKSGHTLPPNLERDVSDIPYLKVADMTFQGNETEVVTSSRFVSRSDVKPAGIIPAGSTIFPKRGGAILTNKKRITRTPTWLDLNIMAVIPSKVVHPELLWMYFESVDMRRLGSGSSIPQINNYDIAPLRIAMPEDVALQTKVATRLIALKEQCTLLEATYRLRLDHFARLRASLLEKAFSGQLTGKEAVAA